MPTRGIARETGRLARPFASTFSNTHSSGMLTSTTLAFMTRKSGKCTNTSSTPSKTDVVEVRMEPSADTTAPVPVYTSWPSRMQYTPTTASWHAAASRSAAVSAARKGMAERQARQIAHDTIRRQPAMD